MFCQKTKPVWQLWNGQAHWCRFADLLAWSLWMRWSHSTQAQSMVSHCRLTSPTGQRLFTDAQ
jgi:hypothetical protein